MKLDLVRRRRTTRLYLCEMLAKGKKRTASRELPQLHHRKQKTAHKIAHKSEAKEEAS
jgi:hypothetical protein